jgi:hypothetical protein
MDYTADFQPSQHNYATDATVSIYDLLANTFSWNEYLRSFNYDYHYKQQIRNIDVVEGYINYCLECVGNIDPVF